MNLLTRHSIISHPLVRQVELAPDRIATVSGIDRLGNLSARSVSVSATLNRLSNFLTTTVQPAVSKLGDRTAIGEQCPLGDLPPDLYEALAADLRALVTTRKLLTFALVAATDLPVLQTFFGANTSNHSGLDRGQPLIQELSGNVLPSELSAEHVLVSDFSDTYEDGRAPHVVVGLNPSEWCKSWATGTPDQREFVMWAFADAESSAMTSRDYRALREIGAQVIPSTRLYRALRSPQFLAYLIVFLYSSLRALPAVFVDNFYGSVAVLWTMDVLTAIPYTWGIIAFMTSPKRWVRYSGLVITLVTFIAPYVYFWSHGQGYSIVVNAVVAAMIIGAIGWEAVNYVRDRAVADGLRQGSQQRTLRVSEQ